MSRAAKKYYEARSREIRAELPPLLDGVPRHLLTPGDTFNTKEAEILFRRALKGMGGFALRAVVHEYPEAAGLKPNRHALTQEAYAGKLLTWLNEVAQKDDEGLYMAYTEAMARKEIPDRALFRVTDNHYELRDPSKEKAQTYLVTTAIPRDKNTEPSAHFTLVSGLYSPNASTKALTPLYLGRPLTQRETAQLPDYWKRSR